MSVSVHRIYVGGLPPTFSETELSALIGKIAPVTSIYVPEIPQTGIHRGFAIVLISGTNEQFAKCVHTFNACRWKGTRLRFEPAKQYYIDRLREEKFNLSKIEPPKSVGVEPMKHVSRESMLKLRCGKNRYMYVPAFSSTKNTMIKFDTVEETASEEFVERKDTILSSCADTGSCTGSDYDSHSSLDSITENAIHTSSKGFQFQKPDVQSFSTADVNVDSGSEYIKPKGGGRRVGFGSISDSQLADKENKIFPSENTERTLELKKDANFDDDEFGNECGSNDDNGSEMYDENASCMEDWELEDDALMSERRRQRAMVEALMNGSSDIATVVKGECGPDSSALNFKTCHNPGIVKVNKWSVQPNLRFDPSITTRLSALSSNDEAYQHRLQFELATSEQALRDNSVVIDNADVGSCEKKDILMTKGTFDESNNENFANISKLKGIFQAPDAENETSVEQTRAEDSLFTEAEKIGIDVRDDAGSGLLFNFFDEEAALPSGTISTVQSDCALPATVLSPNFDEESDAIQQQQQQEEGNLSPTKLPNLTSVFVKAFSFHRDIQEEELNEVWRSTKGKLVVDYKRKCKEARKRKRCSFVRLADAETRPRKDCAVGSAPKKFDAKSRKKKNRQKKR